MRKIKDDEDLKPLCMAVGHITILWGITEYSLDLCISAFFHTCGGSKLKSFHELPRSLNKKIEFVRACVKNIPSLAEFQEEALELMDMISGLKEERHKLTHAALFAAASSVDTFVFSKLSVTKDWHYEEEVEFDLKDFPTYELVFGSLASDTIDFAHKISERFLK